MSDPSHTARGSSPLARGLLDTPVQPCRSEGIIPARAGFTARPATSRPRPPDHPRSRGVYMRSIRGFLSLLGSSPLARGLRFAGELFRCVHGIIPARAGFTDDGHNPGPADWDHPRSRGVYSGRSTYVSQHAGSSPLARGLRLGAAEADRPRGIIPARAGFTCGPLGGSFHYWDHPRSRGVYGSLVSSSAVYTGSSPLARGLRTTDTTPGRPTGIIPARAGFTQGGPHTSPSTRDHPRSRGVYVWELLKQTGREGSSPLARGLRMLPPPPPRTAGIIPARAGFT